MLSPKLFLVLMVLVAPEFRSTSSDLLQDTTTIDSLFKTVFPQQLAVLKNLTSSLNGVCQNFTANYQRPSKPSVRFFLYNDPSNLNRAEEIKTGDLAGLKETLFNPAWPTKFLIHGFTETYTTPCIFPTSTKDIFLQLGIKVNLILVDYSEVTLYWTYFVATNIGLLECRDQGVAFVEFLHKNNLIDVSQMHIIGYSLGGQVAGIIAAGVYKLLNILVGKLTAIDPAGPTFYPVICSQHQLSKTDAAYVEVIHTDSNIVGLGIAQSCGHADFFINGGMNQRYCVDPVLRHFSAPYIYEATIVSSSPLCASKRIDARAFNAFRDCCDGTVYMGENNNRTAFGDYCVPYTVQMILPPVLRSLKTCLTRILGLPTLL